jgi:RimJ/RimL family protein N-acetyltransferase
MRGPASESSSPREIVAVGEEIALAELADGELEAMLAGADDPVEPDRDGRAPLATVDAHSLAVVGKDTGELLGIVTWHAVGYGPSATREAWDLGGTVLPAARGRGIGAAALRLLVAHLFATTEVDRLEAGTDPADLAARRSLSRVGFRAEGVVRGARRRGGKRRDQVRYGLLRSDLMSADGHRVLVAQRDGIGLAEVVVGDQEVFDGSRSEFDLDPDPRPAPMPPSPSSWLVIIDLERGLPIGGLSYRVVSYGGSLGCLAWNIGVGLLPEERGRGVGTLAQRLLAEHLFATTELDRVEASTDVDNVAEQRALEKAGFRREGVVRGAQLRGGRRRDVALYGLVRADLG